MQHTNIEIKATCTNVETIRAILQSKNANFHGTDHQIDTYFKVPKGRLKLREGTIENYLIHYEREDMAGPKQSNVSLYKTDPAANLKDVLAKSLDILVVVDKLREIYFISNIKFHLDTVQGLGNFVEIEAISSGGSIDVATLREQCQQYLELFGIMPKNLIEKSYSDLLLAKSSGKSQ